MTDRKLDNTLYQYLQSFINAALPLEYAIRAARQAAPRKFEQLLEIDQKIRRHWIDIGASEVDVDNEHLIDFAWDVIQVDFPLTLNRYWRGRNDPELADLICRGLKTLGEQFSAEILALEIPATRFFRVCDLLKGNNLRWLIDVTAKCLRNSKGYEAGDSVELEKFVLGVRLPIHIHPGVRYVTTKRSELERSVECFGIALDTEMEFSVTDLKRQIHQFLYQFAVRRQVLYPERIEDELSRNLISEFLANERDGLFDAQMANRLDGFVSRLTGLYCWDLVQQNRLLRGKAALDDAIANTLAIYPKEVREVTEGAIKKNYNIARSAISKVSFDVPLAHKQPQSGTTW